MAEMKISDLSIGDWVQTEDCDARQNKCCVVEGIEKWRPDYVVVLKYEDGGIETLGRECISPIPLTPEILEKNGFEENCERWYNSEALMEFEQYKCGWCRTINCGEYSVYFIKYVHQLQRAMKLEGTEKEIIL